MKKTNVLSASLPIAMGIALSILATACNNSKPDGAETVVATEGKPENFDYGHVKNGKYINDFFNFSMRIPKDWTVQAKEQIEDLIKDSQKRATGDHEKLDAIIEASKINTANLVAASKYRVGTAVSFNPNLVLVAENISKFPDVKTGKDYLVQARKLLLQSTVEYDKIDDQINKEVIHGTDFYTMHAIMTQRGQTMHQLYYSTISKGFSFNLIISYSSEAEKAELLELVKTMKFDK